MHDIIDTLNTGEGDRLNFAWDFFTHRYSFLLGTAKRKKKIAPIQLGPIIWLLCNGDKR